MFVYRGVANYRSQKQIFADSSLQCIKNGFCVSDSKLARNNASNKIG
jgi:hypothetical protein